jgi:hypothetical protein
METGSISFMGEETYLEEAYHEEVILNIIIKLDHPYTIWALLHIFATTCCNL